MLVSSLKSWTVRALKPTVFADLIAMNALYRPGPMEYIPSFIRRKHGEEEIVYDDDLVDDIAFEESNSCQACFGVDDKDVDDAWIGCSSCGWWFH